MTQVGHVITGAAISVLSVPNRITPRQRTIYTIVFMLLATVPDWPFKNWGHDRYYLSHSLFVTLLFLMLLFIAFYFLRDLRQKIGGALAWLSHLLLDSFYNHGEGVAIYWPVSSASLALPIPWFEVGTGPLAHLMRVFLIELISYMPLLLLALLVCRMLHKEKHQV